MVMAVAMVRAAELAESKAAWREVLGTTLPSSMTATNSCQESNGSSSWNLERVFQELYAQ